MKVLKPTDDIVLMHDLQISTFRKLQVPINYFTFETDIYQYEMVELDTIVAI